MSDQGRQPASGSPQWQPDPLLLPRTALRRFSPAPALLDHGKRFEPRGPIVIRLDEAQAAQALEDDADPAPAEAAEAAQPVAEPQPAPVIQGYTEAELQAAADRAREQGIAEGLRQNQQRVAEEIAALKAVAGALDGFMAQPASLVRQLESLAVHLAEQLVRAELSLSPKAITALVENIVNELEQAGFNTAVIHLNPQDLACLDNLSVSLPATMQCAADPSLSRGSVRASTDDTVFADLLEHRLAELVEGVFGVRAASAAGNGPDAAP